MPHKDPTARYKANKAWLARHPNKSKEYNANYRGEPGSERRKRYNEHQRKINLEIRGEPGSEKRKEDNRKRRERRALKIEEYRAAERRHHHNSAKQKILAELDALRPKWDAKRKAAKAPAIGYVGKLNKACSEVLG